jgi:RNA polymerase-binding transcription factor DksA
LTNNTFVLRYSAELAFSQTRTQIYHNNTEGDDTVSEEKILTTHERLILTTFFQGEVERLKNDIAACDQELAQVSVPRKEVFDQAQDSQTADIDLRLLQSKQTELQRVRKFLVMLNSGWDGLCTECGTSVVERLLKTRQPTEHCVECKAAIQNDTYALVRYAT